MPRYIDADKLKEQLEDFSKWCKVVKEQRKICETNTL